MTVELKRAERHMGIRYGTHAKYATVDQDFNQLSGWETCKDYLTQRMVYAHHGRVTDGTSYPRIPFDKARVGFYRHPGYERAETLIHQVEDAFGFSHSTWEPTTTDESYWEGDPRWLIAPPMYGLWTLLMRIDDVQCSSLTKTLTASTLLYSNEAKRMVEFVAEHGPETVFGTDPDKNWCFLPHHLSLHSDLGPCAYVQAATKKVHSHWKFPGL